MKIKDVTFQVEVNKFRDWTTEIVDDMYPVQRFVNEIKQKTRVSLSLRELDEYMNIPPEERLKYLRDNWYI